MAQGEKFPWYHLNSRKTGHLNSFNGHHRAALLSSGSLLQGDNPNQVMHAHTNRALSGMTYRNENSPSKHLTLLKYHILQFLSTEIAKSVSTFLTASFN